MDGNHPKIYHRIARAEILDWGRKAEVVRLFKLGLQNPRLSRWTTVSLLGYALRVASAGARGIISFVASELKMRP